MALGYRRRRGRRCRNAKKKATKTVFFAVALSSATVASLGASLYTSVGLSVCVFVCATKGERFRGSQHSTPANSAIPDSSFHIDDVM